MLFHRGHRNQQCFFVILSFALILSHVHASILIYVQEYAFHFHSSWFKFPTCLNLTEGNFIFSFKSNSSITQSSFLDVNFARNYWPGQKANWISNQIYYLRGTMCWWHCLPSYLIQYVLQSSCMSARCSWFDLWFTAFSQCTRSRWDSAESFILSECKIILMVLRESWKQKVALNNIRGRMRQKIDASK